MSHLRFDKHLDCRHNLTKLLIFNPPTVIVIHDTSETGRLNEKLHAAREVLLSILSLANYKSFICTKFHFAGLIKVFKLDVPGT